MNPFPLAVFKILFCLLIIMCLAVDLFVDLFTQLGTHWASWVCRFTSLIKFWNFWSLFLQIFKFYLPLPGLPLCICWYAWWCPTALLGSVYFSAFILFSSQLDNVNWPIFRFVNSFFCLLKSLFNPSSEYFILVIIFFISRDFFWFLFIISIFYWYSLFDETLFTWFSLSLWVRLKQLT